jgi:hypothetical protein
VNDLRREVLCEARNCVDRNLKGVRTVKGAMPVVGRAVSTKEACMVKQGMLSVIVMLGLAGAGCVEEEGVGGDEAQGTGESSVKQTSTKEAGDLGAQYATTVCWSSAGLYYSPCGTVRENMPYGRRVDRRALPKLQNCNFEYWTEVTHHATGHQGWVRESALCF